MISTQNLSNVGPSENRNWFVKVVRNLKFDSFITEMGVVQLGPFSNQTECDVIF